MERLIVVVFDSLNKASQALQALEDLSEQSAIALTADAVLTRHLDGSISVVQDDYVNPDATMGGTAMGTLFGMLGGPVGMAVGAAAGFLVGGATDVARSRVGRHFAAEVESTLEPGKSAVVAEIDEEDTDAVDSKMEALGGRVLRRSFSDVADHQRARAFARIEGALKRH
jgi:uncharacterized membrane protein